jgi:hypothetical protein
MAQLPTVGGDDGNWGTILNEFLEVEHDADGKHDGILYSTQTLTDGANIDWNLSAGVMATITLGGNRTLNNATNLKNGASYILIIKQDGTGSRTLSFGSTYKFADGVDPTLSTGANSIDIISFLSDGTNLYGSFLGNFS